MNEKAKAVVDNIKPLLEVCLKYAQRFDADEIRITVERAKEIQTLVKTLEESLQQNKDNKNFMLIPCPS